MRKEPGVNIAGDTGGVVSQRHGRATHDEHVGDDTSAGQAFTQGSESPYEVGRWLAFGSQKQLAVIHGSQGSRRLAATCPAP